MRERIEKPEFCPICGLKKKLELSNKDHEYKEDEKDWWWLCHKCHYWFDRKNNRPSNFKKKFDSLFVKSDK